MSLKSGMMRDIQGMLDLKVALGYAADTHKYRLNDFDGYCYRHFPKASILTEEMAMGWLVKKENESGNNQKLRMTTVRELGKYQMAMGMDAYVLPREMIGTTTRFIPYLFSDDELKVLFETMDTLGPGKTKHSSDRGLILPVVYRMLYCCGLRPGEPLRLKHDDVNLKNGELFIRNSKGGKDRIVMMSDELLEMSSRYDSWMGKRDYFFQSPGYGMYRTNWLRTNLHKYWEASGLNQGVKQPRVYDFRHNFATRTMMRWVDTGTDILSMIPALSEYMGHYDFKTTMYYIHLLPERLVRSAGIDWDRFAGIYPEVKK